MLLQCRGVFYATPFCSTINWIRRYFAVNVAAWLLCEEGRFMEIISMLCMIYFRSIFIYRVGQKVTPFWFLGFIFFLVRRSIFAICVYSGTIFIRPKSRIIIVCHVNTCKFCFYANKLYCHHDGWINWRWTLRVEKQCGPESIMKMFSISNKSTRVSCE